MASFKKNILLGTILLSLNLATAQKVPQKELDSLQEVLETMDNSNTDVLVSRGEFILSHSQSDFQKYEVLGVIINAYATKNEKEKSIRYLFRAKAIAEKIDDPEMMIKVYSTIASLYASLNLNAKAEEYLKLCHKQINRLPAGNKGYNLKAFVFSETGTIHYNNQDYTLANKYYKKSLSEYDKILLTDTVLNTSFYYQNAVYNLGKSFLYIQKHDSALFYLNRALTIKNISRPYLKYYIKTSLAEVYSSLGNNNRSLDTLHAILNDPLFENNELRAEIYLDLAHNYKTLGDEANYGLYNEKYLSISPNLKGEDLSAINSVFNAEEDKLKASISTSRRNTQLLFWFIMGIIILSGGSIYYIFQKRKKEQLIYKSLIKNLESKQANDKKSSLEDDSFSPSQQVNIATSVEEEILKKLNKFEKSQQFTNTKLTMGSLAVKLKTNTTYLSDIINREKGKNYNAYINELRINYICEKIHSNPEYLDYKISYLAEASGFSSHSSFATVFKNITGISPSVFLKKERSKAGIKKLPKST